MQFFYLINIWMPNFGKEPHGRRWVRIIRRELELSLWGKKHYNSLLMKINQNKTILWSSRLGRVWGSRNPIVEGRINSYCLVLLHKLLIVIPWYRVSGGPKMATSQSNKTSSLTSLTLKPSTGSSWMLLYSKERALTALLLGWAAMISKREKLNQMNPQMGSFVSWNSGC